MTAPNIDEQVPVRSFFDPREIEEDDTFTKDEEQESTLRRVYVLLKAESKRLHSFDAFDLQETELKIKQQIKAHKLAADIIDPLVETVAQALATVDEKFRQRNNK